MTMPPLPCRRVELIEMHFGILICKDYFSSCQAVRSKRNNSSSNEDEEEPEINGRVAGTVRRHIPLDSRDPPGAILHFYVGDSYDHHRLFLKSHCLVVFMLALNDFKSPEFFILLDFFLFYNVFFTSKVGEDHILRKFQPRGTWYLTVLGSLATTQREYVALHAFCRLNLQVTTKFSL